MEQAKSELMAVVEFLKNPAKFQKLGAQIVMPGQRIISDPRHQIIGQVVHLCHPGRVAPHDMRALFCPADVRSPSVQRQKPFGPVRIR